MVSCESDQGGGEREAQSRWKDRPHGGEAGVCVGQGLQATGQVDKTVTRNEFRL